MGSSVQKSCRAEQIATPQAAALHAAAAAAAAAAAVAASKLPSENPKGWRAQGQYYVSKRVFIPDSQHPLLSLTLEQLGFLPPRAKQLGIQALCWRPLKPLPDVLGRPEGMGLTSSGILVQESACKSF